MEGSGSSVRAGRRDMSSSASVSRAFLSASPQTITSSCLGHQEHTIGKVRHLIELRLVYPNPGFRKRLDDACTKVGRNRISSFVETLTVCKILLLLF